MERLDRCHLHLKLEVQRLTCLGRELNLGLNGGGKHSSKELFKQHVNSHLEQPVQESFITLLLLIRIASPASGRLFQENNDVTVLIQTFPSMRDPVCLGPKI
jgi:hypothetical protein